MSCVILAKLPDLWVLPLLYYVISVTLPDFSVHNIKMCVILDKLPDLSVLPLMSSLILGKLPELSVGFPVHQQLLELAQTPLHRVNDDIQLTHPLSPTWNPAIKISTIWVFSRESVFHIRWPDCWNFNSSISPSNECSGLMSFRMNWIHLLELKRLSRVFSNTPVQKHHFFGAQLSLPSNSHIHTWLLEKPQLWLEGPL